jgi:phosphate regulon transcriptional regulator PhoB
VRPTDTVRSRILVADDNTRTQEAIALYLRHAGYEVDVAATGPEALARAADVNPDLIVLDVMLPGLSGLDVCRALRERTDVPIIMVTARTSEDDKLEGLECGADDYVTKPFSMRELIARVRALLRRHEPTPQRNNLQRGDLYIDPSAHTVSVSGKHVELSALEFRLLHYLAAHPGMVFSRDHLLDRVWGNDRSVTPRSVDVYIRRVREKIEDQPQHPAYVQTVHGVGYRFSAERD